MECVIEIMREKEKDFYLVRQREYRLYTSTLKEKERVRNRKLVKD